MKTEIVKLLKLIGVYGILILLYYIHPTTFMRIFNIFYIIYAIVLVISGVIVIFSLLLFSEYHSFYEIAVKFWEKFLNVKTIMYNSIFYLISLFFFAVSKQNAYIWILGLTILYEITIIKLVVKYIKSYKK